MAENEKQNSDQTPANPSAGDVFAGDLNLNPSVDDIFAGDENLRKALEAENQQKHSLPKHSVTYEVQAPGKESFSSRGVSATHIMLGALTIAVLCMVFKPLPPTVVQLPQDYYSAGESVLAKEPNVVGHQPGEETAQADSVSQDQQQTETLTDLPEEEYFVFDVPLSWKLAHTLFTEKKYKQAYYVYEKLSENLALNDSQKDLIKDVLVLQMSLCLYFDSDSGDFSHLLTGVLKSRSPAVRTLANYYLSFIEFKAKQFLSARGRAYQAISTLESVIEYFPKTMEADCYFLMANALTCEIIGLSNADTNLPGKLWADMITPYLIPEMNASELSVFLNKGIDSFSKAALEPVVETRKSITADSKYSATSLDASAEELISRFAAISRFEIIWSDSSKEYLQRPVTMLLPRASSQEIPELAMGSIGLIARFDGSKIAILNPMSYSSLVRHQKLLTSEAISIWRRFLLRYRGDVRTVNAHYCLAILQEFAGMPHVAIGEYKIIISQYHKSSLAPFALLNSSKIKTNLNNYYGARQDLKQLVLEYADAKISDRAYLYLARANMASELYDEAFKLFKKVYFLNLTDVAKAESAYGAAICNYNLADYKEAEQWFAKCFKFIPDVSSIDIHEAYYFLAKTKFTLGKHAQAIEAYKYALAGNLTKEEFSKIVLELTDTLVERGDLVESINMLENIPESSLPPYQACEVLRAKVRVFRAMKVPENGITLLRHRIEYMADYQLRAKLVLELARCYVDVGELDIAHEEIVTAIADLPAGDLALEANNELAEICIDLGKHQQAVDVCLRLLNTPVPQDVRYRAFRILGTAYNQQKNFKKAAEAFAGIYDKYEVSKL